MPQLINLHLSTIQATNIAMSCTRRYSSRALKDRYKLNSHRHGALRNKFQQRKHETKQRKKKLTHYLYCCFCPHPIVRNYPFLNY
ncbi:hypothetical protein EUGRSUZ_E01512 [Eucalyptus grandis]|uniref:Uncharacterized protein n=2 Tax=Eucalyptus grandis TaxID=71139 RepID=A0ACC3KVD7_EUCGR|nr:hypothetical protein EUGRSUZ_E01512 [Eucalyptus grandis]